MVESALAGDLGVPQIGCSRCAEYETALGKARVIITKQAQLLAIAEGFIKSYQSENANRDARRAKGKKRSKAGLVAVPGEPTTNTPAQ